MLAVAALSRNSRKLPACSDCPPASMAAVPAASCTEAGVTEEAFQNDDLQNNLNVLLTTARKSWTLVVDQLDN